MTENQPTESIELPEELTEQDQADLAALWGEAADTNYRSIFLIWDEILKPENLESNRGMTMQAATVICGRYPQMTYGLVEAFERLYFEVMGDLATTLHNAVEAKRGDEHDPLGVDNAEEDVARNGEDYVELLMTWQEQLTAWEISWQPSHPEAPAWVAALGEVQNFFFGERGLTGHLEVIKLEFTEEHVETLQRRLQAVRDNKEA